MVDKFVLLLFGVFISVALFCCGCSQVLMDDPTGADIAIQEIAAQSTKLIIKTNCPTYLPVALIDVPPYTRYTPGADLPVAFKGKVNGGKIIIDRFVGPVDRLYHKFQLINPQTLQTLGFAHWVTDLSALPRRNFEIPWPKNTIKGLSCITSLEDAKHLGVRYATDNIILNLALDFSGNPKETWMVDGVKIPINTSYFEELDKKIKGMNEIGRASCRERV